MKSKYIVIDKEILPDVFEKVLRAKDLIRRGKVKGITDAVKNVEISRSTFYKYKDYVFPLSEGNLGKMVTISLLLEHETGVLSDIINGIAKKNGNILTINQNIPINNIANVTITFDISNLSIDFEVLMDRLRNSSGVNMLNIIAMS